VYHEVHGVSVFFLLSPAGLLAGGHHGRVHDPAARSGRRLGAQARQGAQGRRPPRLCGLGRLRSLVRHLHRVVVRRIRVRVASRPCVSCRGTQTRVACQPQKKMKKKVGNRTENRCWSRGRTCCG
jgi:hypothetical protein